MNNPLEQWEKIALEREWDSLESKADFARFYAKESSIPIYQKIGTIIPFSRTVDKDPWPRIPLSIPENSYPKISKKEAIFWIIVVAVFVSYWV
jgi:hypothetical protein